ncbi:MAG: O-antigen ligase family protein [Clostridia bacterium]|nr:O-antigen ligase family protein [Clostridia bacterium]
MGRSYTLIMMSLMGVWLLTTLMCNREWIKIKNNGFFSVVLLMVFYVLVVVIGAGNARAHAVLLMAPYFGYFVFYYYIFTNQRKDLAIVTIILFIGLMITFYTSAIADDHYAYREIRDIDEIMQTNYSANIGTTHHVYSAALIGCVLCSFVQSGDIKDRKTRIILLACGILSYYMVFVSSSGIAVVCAAISIVGILLQKQSLAVKLVAIIFLLGCFFILRDSIGSTLQHLSSSIDNKYISAKLYDLGDSIGTGNATGEFAARTDLWKEDWRTFVGSYGFGIGSYYVGAGNSTFVVRDHSQLLSDAARYGIVFTGYMVYLFGRYMKMLKELMLSYEMKCDLGSYFLIFVIMYFCQPTFLNLVIPTVCLFLIPGLIVMIGEQKKRILEKEKEELEWQKAESETRYGTSSMA